MADNQDTLSPEDLLALHQTYLHLSEAGDPRADKLRQYLVMSGKQALASPDANQTQFEQQNAPHSTSLGDTVAGVAKSVGGAIKGMATTAGNLIQAGGPMRDTSGITQQAIATKQAMQQAYNAPPPGASTVERVAMGAAPVVGVDPMALAQAARQRDPGGAIVATAPALIAATAPAAADAAVGKFGSAVQAKLAAYAPDLYRSALKPTTVPKMQAQVQAGIQTGLDHGIPVSEAGLEKLSGLIEDTNDKIAAAIQADPTRPIDPAKVAQRADQVRSRFTNQVNPQADLAAVDASKQEFLQGQSAVRGYHGTEANYSGAPDTSGLGAHFTTDPNTAARFTTDAGAKPRVIAADLNIKNPLRIEDHGGSHNLASSTVQSLVDQNKIPASFADGLADRIMSRHDQLVKQGMDAHDAFDQANLEELGKVKSYLKQQGYDGIVYKNTTEGGGDSYVAFDQKQITPTSQQSPPGLNPINAEDAQAMKQGTYQQLKGKAYGELKTASVEAQKGLARGLKEELAQAFPELNNLNAQDSQFYGFEPILQRAVARIDNHQLVGLGTPAVAAAAKAATGSKVASMVAGTMKAIVDNPAVKSRLAIMINKASKGTVTLPQAIARIGAYSGALAQSAASGNEQPDANQPASPAN